jgi:hypothetical protein
MGWWPWLYREEMGKRKVHPVFAFAGSTEKEHCAAVDRHWRNCTIHHSPFTIYIRGHTPWAATCLCYGKDAAVTKLLGCCPQTLFPVTVHALLRQNRGDPFSCRRALLFLRDCVSCAVGTKLATLWR